MVQHPRGNVVESLYRKLAIRLSRCAKACFLEPDGRTPTYEGNRVLADLRSFAKLDHNRKQTAFARDTALRLDLAAMARIEGRREVVWRLMQLLELDETTVQSLVEVKDE